MSVLKDHNKIRSYLGMKKLLILLLLVPTLAMSGTFKNDEGKFGLKTKKSGFKFHLNFMDHNDHNFQYIKDKTKARAGTQPFVERPQTRF